MPRRDPIPRSEPPGKAGRRGTGLDWGSSPGKNKGRGRKGFGTKELRGKTEPKRGIIRGRRRRGRTWGRGGVEKRGKKKRRNRVFNRVLFQPQQNEMKPSIGDFLRSTIRVQ